MSRERIGAFLDRDWKALSELKEKTWLKDKAKGGAAAGIRVADQMRAQVRRARPDWPSKKERAADYEMHLYLIDVISRVGRCSD